MIVTVVQINNTKPLVLSCLARITSTIPTVPVVTAVLTSQYLADLHTSVKCFKMYLQLKLGHILV